MQIIDKDGVWVRSVAHFPLQDPESGTRFEPGVAYKATSTAWLEGQAALVTIADPLAKDEDTAAPSAPAEPAKAPVAAPVKTPAAAK